MSRPLARTTDSGTSHAAAARVSFASAHKAIIHEVLRTHGPLGKDGIAQWSYLSGVMVARRLPEMADQGLVALTGKYVASNTGRLERQWRAL